MYLLLHNCTIHEALKVLLSIRGKIDTVTVCTVHTPVCRSSNSPDEQGR